MAKRGKKAAAGDAPPRACAVTVCHGCCCARTEDGRRDAAAVGRLAELKAAAPVTVADCLGPCEDRDVLVVRPSAAGRGAGARPVWLAWTGDADVHADVLAWVRAGGPGEADLPASLEGHVFTPSRRYRDDTRAR